MSVWMVTGGAGMLAQEVRARLAAAGIGTAVLGRAELDIADPASVAAAMEAHRPAVVVNCAAWTAVDDAETHEEAALAVNGTGPRLLAESCRRAGAVLLHVST
ncbi:MAG TPA: sugar nucleotide-binding protein, partial [Glycomyces sp.]|nr:sugar nucleotide-binding protein [Glycomyces sp.]